MQNHNEHAGCMCCGLSRRSFLASGCAACAGGALAGGFLPFSKNAYGEDAPGKMTVRVIFALHAPVQPGPDWPNVGFDFQPVMENTMNALAAGCPDVVFLPTMANGTEQTQEIVAKDAEAGNVDGYLVMQMNCWNTVVQTAVDTGKPVLYADFLYAGSGGFLVYTSSMLRWKRPNFAFMSSGRIDDLVAAAGCFPLARGEDGVAAFVQAVTDVRKSRTPEAPDMTCLEDNFETLTTEELLKELKGKKLLEFESGWHGIADQVRESLGIEIVRLPFAELNDAWEKADRAEAAKIVARWKEEAESIEGISEETLEASARMVLAQKTILKAHDASAITINCLGGFYGGHIHAYPCLAFHELQNEGLIGACECDTRSTLTMLVMTTLTKGRPGFISDPVMDIASREIIYAHCVASKKVFGPEGPVNPFHILTHSEDRAGASVRATLPAGYMTTTLELAPERKQILFHQAKAVGNSTEDRACRTKLAGAPVGDYEKLFTEWDSWGWHRVTFYGDLKAQVFALAEALGWTVIEEA